MIDYVIYFASFGKWWCVRVVQVTFFFFGGGGGGGGGGWDALNEISQNQDNLQIKDAVNGISRINLIGKAAIANATIWMSLNPPKGSKHVFQIVKNLLLTTVKHCLYFKLFDFLFLCAKIHLITERKLVSVCLCVSENRGIMPAE